MLNSEAQMPIQKNSRYVKLLVSQMIVQLFSLIFIDLKLNFHQTRTTQFQTELIKQLQRNQKGRSQKSSNKEISNEKSPTVGKC